MVASKWLSIVQGLDGQLLDAHSVFCPLFADCLAIVPCHRFAIVFVSVRMLLGCNQNDIGVLPGCRWDIAGMLFGCYQETARTFSAHLASVLPFRIMGTSKKCHFGSRELRQSQSHQRLLHHEIDEI
jgi:hypothetical protein